MKKLILYLIILFLPLLVFNQEYLTGLSSNPVIENYLLNTKPEDLYKSRVLTYEPLNLPFHDDFSGSTIYPDTNLWTDNYAYINAQYPYFPVDYGVATLDVLDATGNLYSYGSTFPFIADHLTSRPIRLDSVFDPGIGSMRQLTPDDSVYLSFYYQPQGRGDVPLKYDSLVLEFGHYNGDTLFSHIDYFWLYINTLIKPNGEPFGEGDTLFPLDTIYYDGCDINYAVAYQPYVYTDSIYVPCDSVYVLDEDWTYMWSAPGDTLSEFLNKNDVYFKRITIPIANEKWFRGDFQFRFFNYGSLSTISSWQSNTDHWHIDQVYLDYNRTMDDHFKHEIKFVETPASFIKGFYSMPFWQYVEGLKKESIPMYINNIDSISHVCEYNYFVTDENGATLPAFNWPGYTSSLSPLSSLTASNYGPFTDAPVNYWYEYLGNGNVSFDINHIVYDTQDPNIGDTIVFKQEFKNYFAYDDGSVERGYGLLINGGRQVVQYRTESEDTLRGVQIFFNKTQNNHNDNIFYIGLWNDNNGEPGLLKYKSNAFRPEFTSTNLFHNYIFEDTIIKLGREVFYVGLIQTTSDFLNIGFDRNTNTKSRNFFNTGAGWTKSAFEGSLMIRPLLGPSLTEPEEVQGKAKSSELEIFPNPPGNAQDITIQLPVACADPGHRKYLELRIFDLYGKRLYSGPYIEKINVNAFKNGFYIVDLFDTANTQHYSTKLLITK
ncbi:MAG: hypothetical protein R2764_09690 [Bacteroidales bacterium]